MASESSGFSGPVAVSVAVSVVVDATASVASIAPFAVDAAVAMTVRRPPRRRRACARGRHLTDQKWPAGIQKRSNNLVHDRVVSPIAQESIGHGRTAYRYKNLGKCTHDRGITDHPKVPDNPLPK